MSLILHTAPTEIPVSLAEVKLFLRVDHSDEDDFIEALISAATLSAESIMNRAVMNQHWKLLTNSFNDLQLRKPKVTAVSSVKYIDTNGDLITLDSSFYQPVLSNDYEAYVVAAYDKTFPEVRNQPESVQVIFTCGYATAADVPEDIKTWIKLCVGSLYEKRQLESERQTYSLGLADQLLYRYKVYFS